MSPNIHLPHDEHKPRKSWQKAGRSLLLDRDGTFATNTNLTASYTIPTEHSALLEILSERRHHVPQPPLLAIMSGGGRKVLLPPINFIFKLLQQHSTVQIWLYEQLGIRIEGTIRGFDEFMNLVRSKIRAMVDSSDAHVRAQTD